MLFAYTNSTKRVPDVIYRARNMTSGNLFVESWLWKAPVDSVLEQFVQFSDACAVDLAIAHLVDEDGGGLSSLAHQQVVEVIAHRLTDRVRIEADYVCRSTCIAHLRKVHIISAILLHAVFPLLENLVLRSTFDAVADAVEYYAGKSRFGADKQVLQAHTVMHVDTQYGYLLHVAFEAELSIGLDKDRVDRTWMRSLHRNEIEAGAVKAIGRKASFDDKVAWCDFCRLCVFF